MATATLTMTKQEEAFTSMQGSVSRYARANDRRMVLRSMREVKYLNCIELDGTNVNMENIKAVEDELIGEDNIILNGIPFHGSQHFLTTLKELCSKLCDQEGVSMKHTDLYNNLIARMARSTASADSFFKLNSLIGSPDLMLMPTTQKQVFPIKLNLYVSAGDIHITLTSTNAFGLFRKADVKPSELGRMGPIASRPWIGIRGTVEERANVSSGSAVRHVKVTLPESLY